MDVTRALLATYLFQDLSPAELAGLIPLVSVREVRRGDNVFRVGDVADEVWVVASGQIREYAVDRDGNQYVSELLGEGAVFGEPGAFSSERLRVVTEEAAVASVVIRVPREPLFEFLLRHPPALLRLLEGFASDTRLSVEDMTRASYGSIARRVADRLLALADLHGVLEPDGAMRIATPVSQRELGAMAGCTRENANRVLQELSTRGMLRLESRQIFLTDLPQLRSVAHGGSELHRRNRPRRPIDELGLPAIQNLRRTRKP